MAPCDHCRYPIRHLSILYCLFLQCISLALYHFIRPLQWSNRNLTKISFPHKLECVLDCFPSYMINRNIQRLNSFPFPFPFKVDKLNDFTWKNDVYTNQVFSMVQFRPAFTALIGPYPSYMGAKKVQIFFLCLPSKHHNTCTTCANITSYSSLGS